MSKQEQVLTIKPPNELTFVGPFTQPVSSVMYLSNPSERKVCFKIKTTAPKRYCVKPNSGIIDPSEQVKISGERSIDIGLGTSPNKSSIYYEWPNIGQVTKTDSKDSYHCFPYVSI